jgi:hypothetical protein
MLSIAQDEADRTSERIKVVFENKRARGETTAGKAPTGYKIENSMLLVDENTKQIAIDIFNYYDLHHSVMGCVRMAREKYGYNIYDYSIRRMLENKTYIGEFNGGNNFCEAIISREQFDRVNAYRSVREFKNQLVAGRVYLFSSLVFCKECKHNMSCCFKAQDNKSGFKEYHYYRCKESIQNKCNHHKRINEDYLEEYLLGNLNKAVREKLHITVQRQKNTPRSIDTAKIKRRLEKLTDLYLDDLIDKESYKIEYDSLNAQLSTANSMRLDTSEKYRQYIEKDLPSVYQSFTLTERKTFWLGMIDKIIVDHDNNVDFFLKD